MKGTDDMEAILVKLISCDSQWDEWSVNLHFEGYVQTQIPLYCLLHTEQDMYMTYYYYYYYVNSV